MLPSFIVETLRGFLDCGNLAKGGFSLVCRCGHRELVGYSCKLRGICPSCTARTATDVSERLVREVFPATAEYRHVVVNFPYEVSQKLAFRPELISSSERMVMGHFRAWIEKRCGGKTGGKLFRHRFGSNLNTLIHDHMVLFDGGFIEKDGAQVFVQSPPVEQEDLNELTRRLAKKLEMHLGERGVEFSAGTADATVEDAPGGLVARCRGLHVFASPPVKDREQLKKLCAYLMRCGINVNRLSELPDGRYQYQLSKKDRNGATHLVMTGPEVLQRLASLIPRWRVPQRRYFGVLAAGSPLRKSVVPGRPEQKCTAGLGHMRATWAELMMRVFAIDVLKCPKCGRRMTLDRRLAPVEPFCARKQAAGFIRGPPLISAEA